MPSPDPVWKLDATAQAELVRRRKISPAELVDLAIARIEKLNPRLNAVIHPLFDKARAQAARPLDLPGGPFRGVPFLVKDAVCHTAGDPYHCGMRALKQAGWRESGDTELAARFRRAGFVFVGRTNTPELAFAPTTEPLAYGPTRNPWNPDHSTGGSSGGAAAAVASGMVPAAHGNDMGGSIRIPSSACGLVGLKPTRSRASLGPGFSEFWWVTTHEHVLTRSVRDSAAMLDAIAGPAPGDLYTAPPPVRRFAEEVGQPPGRLRIGLFTRGLAGRPVHADCAEAVGAAARLLESLGHAIEPLDHRGLWQSDGAEFRVFAVALARDLARWSERLGREIRPQELEPVNTMAVQVGRGISGPELLASTEALALAARKLAGLMAEGFDLLLTPTLGEPPPPIGHAGPAAAPPQEVLARWGPLTPFTTPFNVTGQPALSLPLHWNAAGLPIGVQLAAAFGREDLLLRVASQLETAAPWRDRWPSLAT